MTSNTAFLCLDFQQGVLSMHPTAANAVEAAAQALAVARERGMLVIHVGLGFAPGHPEIGEHLPFARLKQAGLFVQGSDSARFDPRLYRDGDLCLYKQRIGAFSRNQLEMVLRNQGITELILTGVATSGIVLSTQRQAFDSDFGCTVLTDACYDPDPEVHRVLCDKLFARSGRIQTVADFRAGV